MMVKVTGKKRSFNEEVTDKGKTLFSGISVMLIGMPNARVKVFSKIIQSNGGTVLTMAKKSSSLAATNRTLSPCPDYIVVEKPMTSRKLCEKLCCDTIPGNVEVVTCEWLVQCAAKKRQVDSDEFDAVLSNGDVDAEDTRESAAECSQESKSKDRNIIKEEKSSSMTVGMLNELLLNGQHLSP